MTVNFRLQHEGYNVASLKIAFRNGLTANIDRLRLMCYGEDPSKGGVSHNEQLAVCGSRTTFRREVSLMPITLTLHIFGYVITIRVKRESNNRHSAK